MTGKELVLRTLEFRNTEGRVPRDLWTLPWAEKRYPGQLEAIRRDYPADIADAPGFSPATGVSRGDPCAVGLYTDDWGCEFVNIHEGVIGEVKNTLAVPVK